METKQRLRAHYSGIECRAEKPSPLCPPSALRRILTDSCRCEDSQKRNFSLLLEFCPACQSLQYYPPWPSFSSFLSSQLHGFLAFKDRPPFWASLVSGGQIRHVPGWSFPSVPGAPAQSRSRCNFDLPRCQLAYYPSVIFQESSSCWWRSYFCYRTALSLSWIYMVSFLLLVQLRYFFLHRWVPMILDRIVGTAS